MNISIKSTLSTRHKVPEVEPKPLHDGCDILGFKFCNSAFCWRGDSLNDEPASICRDIKGFAAHGTRGIWSGTAQLPAVETLGVKLVTAVKFARHALTAHARQAYGTLIPPVLPTLNIGPMNFLFTWGP